MAGMGGARQSAEARADGAGGAARRDAEARWEDRVGSNGERVGAALVACDGAIDLINTHTLYLS